VRLALIERGHSLVADDLTVIKLLDERELMASSRPLNRGYMECRGIGIINIAEMFGIKSIRLEKRIDMVISLREWTPDVLEERTGLEENFYEVLGMRVPHIELYVRPGRDMARLVEVAALTQALKTMGHDPAKDFNDRLIASMAAQAEVKTTKIKPVQRARELSGWVERLECTAPIKARSVGSRNRKIWPQRLSASAKILRFRLLAIPRRNRALMRATTINFQSRPDTPPLRPRHVFLPPRRRTRARSAPPHFVRSEHRAACHRLRARPFGLTRVICAATIETNVPTWMKQQKVPGGWLTAEYSMLPYSTLDRKPREFPAARRGRNIEIQRLIGRSLRSVLDLNKLGQNTLWIDCDVLQADGAPAPPRSPAPYLAARLAVQKLNRRERIPETR